MFVAPMIDPFPESIFEEIEDCFFFVSSHHRWKTEVLSIANAF